MKRIRLRTKFMLLFSIVALLPLMATLVLSYTRLQKTLEEDSAKLETQLASTAANKVKSFIVSQVGILNTLSTLYDQEFSTREDASGKIIANILYRSENFTDISIIDKNGKEIIRQDRLLVFLPQDLRNLGETQAFKTVKEKGLYVGAIYLRDGKPFFDLGRWIVDSQGNFSGAVFAQVDAKVMPDVMSKISAIAGPGGRVFMTNGKGVVIAHSNLSYILGEKDLSELPSIQHIGESRKYLNENNEAVLGSSYPIILESPEITLPEPFPLDWFVVVEQQQSVVFAEADRVALFFAIVSIAVLILTITSSIFFSQKISAPIEKLLKATIEFGKGNLKYRTKIKNNDEIGDLAQNFDKMADAVSGSIEHLQQMEKMKSEFVTIAAHQLRTPLTGMKWALNYLGTENKSNLNEEQTKTVSTLAAATDQMINLVNDLLDISQIEDGKFGIKLERGELAPTLENVRNTFRGNLNKDIKFIVNIASSLPQINLDKHKLEIALNNIINNAYKYSRPGGTVELETKVAGDHIVISVKDSGIGIAPEEQPRIFTKFFRSPRALLQHTDGTGLGLYVSKNIVDQHNGKIWFESEKDKGTTFFISLPIVL